LQLNKKKVYTITNVTTGGISMKTLFIGLMAFAALMSACADPTANKPKASVSEPVKTVAVDNKTPLDFKATGTAVPFGPATSTIEFVGSKVTGKHDGGFKSFSGVVDLIGDKVDTSRVFVEVDMDTIYTDVEDLTKHLKTADFFDVGKYPKASFTSNKIVADPTKGADNYMVTGELDMRGVKKEITFPATITLSPENVVVKSEFSVNRKNFGIAYAGKADDLIRDDVLIQLDIKAPRAK
jgi:polyisoprenoid-binding protein YceI